MLVKSSKSIYISYKDNSYFYIHLVVRFSFVLRETLRIIFVMDENKFLPALQSKMYLRNRPQSLSLFHFVCVRASAATKWAHGIGRRINVKYV